MNADEILTAYRTWLDGRLNGSDATLSAYLEGRQDMTEVALDQLDWFLATREVGPS